MCWVVAACYNHVLGCSSGVIIMCWVVAAEL